MKKAIYSKDGMKQIINSGWKLFDEQTNCISTGNVIANTQFSLFIRPYSETECNGLENPKGHLMNFDLKPFRRYGIPTRIENLIKSENRDKSVILYMFYVTSKEGRIEPFCWAVTDYDHKMIDYQVSLGYKKNHMKRFMAALEAISYISA